MEVEHDRMKHTGLYILSMSVIAASMTLLAGCSAEEAEAGSIPAVAGSDTPITFSANINKSVTRAGETGNIDYSVLALEDYGFGVFAYGADGGNWNNKQVKYVGATPAKDLDDVHMHTGGNWSYGEEIMWKDQIISFLAYAPYVYVSDEQIKDEADAAAADEDEGEGKGEASTGIIEVKEGGIDETYIQYAIATDPSKSVDLLWGVREDANRQNAKRLPWLNTAVKGDVLNTTNGNGVTFSFHHALTAIGFHVQTMIDKTNDKGDYEDESNVEGILGKGHYKVTIKEITLTGKFYETAELYLNNVTSGIPNWKNKLWFEEEETELTVENDQINEAFRHPEDKTIQEFVDNEDFTGVTQDAEQLVIAPNRTTGAEQCFFVIPNETKQKYTVKLGWCVSYKKGNDYVVEEHTNKIPLDDWVLLPEVKYYLNFVIGLKSVRLRVTATDWEDNPINIEEIFEHGTSANESFAKELR